MEKRAKFISFSNLAGGDAVQGLLRLLTVMKKRKVAIIETPCLGIPRMSYALPPEEISKIEKTRSMDQFMIDYERNELKQMSDYMVTSNGIDYLIVHPKSMPESPTIRKLESNQPLIQIPFFIEKQLRETYDYVLMLTQGVLMHPMTHFAIRSADAAILYSGQTTDFVQNFTHHKKLQEVFGVSPERLALFVEDHNIPVVEGVATYSKDISKMLKLIDGLAPNEHNLEAVSSDDHESDEAIGVIDPLEYLDYQVKLTQFTGEFSQSDAETLDQKLVPYVRQKLMDNHLDDYVKSLMNEHERQKVRYFIADIIREQKEYQFNASIPAVIEWVQKEITELGVLQEALDDPTISSIEVNGVNQVMVEQNGVEEHLEHIQFRNNDHLRQTIDKILMPIGKPISSNEPIIDANYQGFRVCVVADNEKFEGISAGSSLISIRKFPPDVYSHEACIEYGNVSQEIIDFQSLVIPAGANIINAGSTNSGKTAHQMRFPLFVPKKTRILSIEDSEEMRLAFKMAYRDYPNLPSLLVKEVEDNPSKSYGIDKLIKTSLRLRPTVICIGEIRDKFAAEQALIGMNTGHTVWATIHANTARDAAIRFLQLNGNTAAAASQTASSIDLIFFQEKSVAGPRVVTEIAELLYFNGTTEPVLNTIFKYNFTTKKHERVGGIMSENLIEKLVKKEIDPAIIEKWAHREPGDAA
ncbi:ATPase, T2SS/T4P/T4SS family [Paenibacillus amylolyticus]|uniref:ATPase, T2SS/T4P/T4SS family n=1 Tax=Paenibacillus amylolyticus TaxID=1451 RepID=A0ABD8B2M7_PAEAM